MDSVVTPTCSPWKTVAVLVAEHVDVVADQMFALAGGLAGADDRRAEAGEHQGAHQKLHGLQVPFIRAAAWAKSGPSSSASKS